MTNAATTPKAKRPTGAATRLLIRDLHLYFSILAAPSLLFFAITGGIQLFGLHEAHSATGYQPPAIVEKLGELHKNQRYILKPRRSPPPAKAAPVKAAIKPVEEKATPVAVTLLKWVSLAVVFSLVSSAGLGLWMGLTQGRNRRVALILLVIGVLLPAILAGLTA
ncbi:hypothetical protein [Caulobacter sp.]|uniref:hypothetical protein n=1 Tax=Caulobacter sp. TaxID=78 RepID=UPI003BAA00E1